MTGRSLIEDNLSLIEDNLILEKAAMELEHALPDILRMLLAREGMFPPFSTCAPHD